MTHGSSTAATTAVVLALLATTPTAVRGVSNGHTFECNPSANFGCSTWTSNDRMKCSEPGPDGSKTPGSRGHMHWVRRAQHTSTYTLRAGMGVDVKTDETHYSPGSVVNLWVTCTEYTAKYKGFFARAVNAKGQAVGEWEFPGTDSQMFWSPPECGARHIIHKDADLKPFRVQIHYRAPPAGTGQYPFTCFPCL